MLDAANYTPRLKAHYTGTVRAALKEEFGYKNDMQIPRIEKVTLNMGVGEAVADSKKIKSAHDDLMAIAGPLILMPPGLCSATVLGWSC